jgi:hypothetical protein
MLNRLTLTLVALLGLSIWGLFYQHGNNSVLSASNKSLTEALEQAAEQSKIDRKVLVARQAQIALQARKLAEAQQGVVEALQRNKSWSDTDVPPDVQNALGGPSGGLAGVFQHD